jgi:lipid II:glycine glycyltransferase (peptidoglycan interpeptide bridge formation enzyme)
MKIFICTFEGKPIAGGVFSAIGETGQYMFGATANNGLKANGSNLIQWTMLKWLKGSGCKWYDSGGIDPSGNPGVYRFKLGIVGKRGKDVSHLGQFVLADNPINYLLNMCIDSIKYSQSILYGGMQLYLKIVHFCFRSTKYTA